MTREEYRLYNQLMSKGEEGRKSKQGILVIQQVNV